MPGPADITPFVKGQELTADQMNEILGRLRSLAPAEPGAFVNSSFSVKRHLHSTSGLYEVAIYPGMSPAAWDKTAKTKSYVEFEFPIFYPSPDGKSGTFNTSNKLKLRNPFATEVTVTAGKFRVGLVLDGILISVDCTELDLP